jgi:hypothetical protein
MTQDEGYDESEFVDEFADSPTSSFAVVKPVTASTAAGRADDADLSQIRHSKIHRRLTVFFSVFAIIVALAVIVMVVLLFFWNQSDDPATGDFVKQLQSATASRDDLKKELTDTKAAVQTLKTDLPNDQSVITLSQTWDSGNSLVTSPPKYFSQRPKSDDETAEAAAQLASYVTSATNTVDQLKQQVNTAGSASAPTYFQDAKTTLSTAISQGQVVLDQYNSGSGAGSAASGSGQDAHQSVVDALTSAMQDGQKLVVSGEQKTPLKTVQIADSMKASASKIQKAYNDLQQAQADGDTKNAQSSDIPASQLAAPNGQIPQFLIGKWTIVSGEDAGGKMTFTVSTIQKLGAHATQIDESKQSAPWGGTAVAAWLLQGDGPNPVGETTVVLYQNASHTFIGIFSGGKSWELTK